MLGLFRRIPTAREMQKRSLLAKRRAYVEFHDRMAAKAGREIRWADAS